MFGSPLEGQRNRSAQDCEALLHFLLLLLLLLHKARRDGSEGEDALNTVTVQDWMTRGREATSYKSSFLGVVESHEEQCVTGKTEAPYYAPYRIPNARRNAVGLTVQDLK
jgi:hypothetical protein